MNIKSVWNSLANIANVSSVKLDKKSKLEASDEKDTQLGSGNEEAPDHQMSEEEAQKALEILKNLDGIKGHNLTCRLELSNSRYVVFIEDSQGKIIRRMPEVEL